MGEESVWSTTTIKNMYNRIRYMRGDVSIKEVTRFAVEIIHARRPKNCRDKVYAELSLFVKYILNKEPQQVRFLLDHVKQHSKGKKVHQNINKWIKQLETKQSRAKPTYHDFANFVRIAIGLKSVKQEHIINFVFRVIRVNPNAKHRHYWQRYPKLKKEYMPGLKNNAKFMMFNSQNIMISGVTLTPFKQIQSSNYFFYDDST